MWLCADHLAIQQRQAKPYEDKGPVKTKSTRSSTDKGPAQPLKVPPLPSTAAMSLPAQPMSAGLGNLELSAAMDHFQVESFS